MSVAGDRPLAHERTKIVGDLAMTAQETVSPLERLETSLHPFASDHVPFIEAGIPATLTIEGADNANSHVHSADDTIDRINYDLALEILRMNVAYVGQLVGN